MNGLTEITEDASNLNHYQLQKQATAEARDLAQALIDQCNTADIHELLDLYLEQQKACDADRNEHGEMLVAGRAANLHLNTINQIASARFGIQFTGGGETWF